MSSENDDQPSHADSHDPAAVQALDDTMHGVWVVTTRGSTHIWDLDAMTYMRRPGPTSPSGPMLFDGRAMPITGVETWPAVGSSFFVWYTDPDFPRFLQQYRISSTVQSIARVEMYADDPSRSDES